MVLHNRLLTNDIGIFVVGNPMLLLQTFLLACNQDMCLLEYVLGGFYILCFGLHTGCVWSLISVTDHRSCLCKTLASFCLI
jgi:hypothetical protein